MSTATSIRRLVLAATTITGLAIAVGTGPAGDSPAYKGSPYPLATCPVSGKPLTKDAVNFVVEDKENPLNDGREVRFCCPNCVGAFKADQAKFLTQVDAAIIAQEKDRYPLTHCVIMTEDAIAKPGEPEFDKVRDIVVLNDLVRICCPGCIKKIKKDPAKIVADVTAAVIAKQKSTYALTTCPISGEALDADAADIVIGERLVRLCCNGCADKARKDPAAIFAKLDAAEAKRAPAATTPAAPATTTPPTKTN